MKADIRRLVALVAVLQAGTSGADVVPPDCICPPGSVEEGVRSAGKIFMGQIIEATFNGTDVEFTVEIDERFRGWVWNRQKLRSSA